MQELLYEDLSFAIRQCVFEVHNDVGVGYDEETYHQGLKRRFALEGISFVSKERTELKHRGIVIREFELDYLIENKVILALKCLPCDFLQVNYIQLFTELKLWQKRLGLLVNFGQPKVKIERRITALQDSITHHDISTIKSYLKALKLAAGLAVNFGKSKLEIKGVRN